MLILCLWIHTTQQYTKVFGPTVLDCFSDGENGLQKISVFEKKKFSMLTEEVLNHLDTKKELQERHSFVLFGIEAHVCVQQTCVSNSLQVLVVIYSEGAKLTRPYVFFC